MNGERIPEFVDLSQVAGITPDAEIDLIEDPYTEKDARLHVLRIRELVGATSDRTDIFQGMQAGLSLHDQVANIGNNAQSNAHLLSSKQHPLSGYEPASPPSINVLIPSEQTPPPKTLKSINVSPWNPPPYQLRSRGHLLYLQVLTLEGETFQITSHVSGFFVNKSTTTKFDPSPRTSPKSCSAHSLLTLLSKLSPGFDSAFKSLQAANGPDARDPLTAFPLSNAFPANPWAVSPSETSLSRHAVDVCRTQESFLISGVDNAETLRDWNEEFQTTRELPRETVQDRVFRERVASKLFADYNEAAVQGAVLIARGEVAPLNPTEPPDAQIFVYNNVFYSYGADGVGTFANEGGDEAARVATGKDVMGVKKVNHMDIADLATPGTAVVDFLGKRIVAQSIVPGIFKQREPGEQQIDYGGVEGKEIVTENEAFAPLFAKLSKALRLKKHPVWDKEGKRHDLESSIETKGLLGTDGRKYVLDLYRITPVDVHWVENGWDQHLEVGEEESAPQRYPHRMSVLRSELVDSYWRMKLDQYIQNELDKMKDSEANGDTLQEPESEQNGEQSPKANGTDADLPKKEQLDRVDFSAFECSFNPDVFSGQQPQTAEEKEEWAKDEADVRTLSIRLLEVVIPKLLKDLQEGDVGFPMDGQSLSSLLHKRGINIRYLGRIAQSTDKAERRLAALKALAEQEMIARAFKHVANKYLRSTPPPLAAACISHLLNCFLGAAVTKDPAVELDEDIKTLYTTGKLEFEEMCPASMELQIVEQVTLRYRYQLEDDWRRQIVPLRMLREVALKLGLQVAAREYQFVRSEVITNGDCQPSEVNGNVTSKMNGHACSGGKKKKKGAASPSRAATNHATTLHQTFHTEDIYNMVPVIKDASARSLLAEEALEAGRMSVSKNYKDLGQDLLLESLSLYEQIYSILHPEVARAYYQLSTLFYGLEDKAIAVELARKAVIVSERTLGIDSHETLLAYLNLGLFEHAVGNSVLALTYVRHALDIWKLVYGPNHPDSITTLNNAAVMLQHLKLYRDSRIWFESSLAISQEVSGPQSVNTATLLFQLAQALALDQESKAAVNRMREAYNIFHGQLGADDRNTKEAETWLENLTQNAVSIAKHAKDMQTRRLRRLNHLSPQVTLGPQPQPNTTPSARIGQSVPSRSGIDERSIDELIKYIEGGDMAKQSTPKKRPTNPKHRR